MRCPSCKGDFSVNKDGHIRRHCVRLNGRKIPCDGDLDFMLERLSNSPSAWGYE